MKMSTLLRSYVLQEDTSQDGATAEQQGQQTHQSHQDVEELPGVALTCSANTSQRSEVTVSVKRDCSRAELLDSPWPNTLGSLHSLMEASFFRLIFTFPLCALLSMTI